ncbi:MAG: Extracellular solute-binding protein family 5 [Candidatus Curtissbacteria bacterium GW2011_GWC1_44_33]|uniref:Extracellular solute-binding protein family 5 n=1 Tax=Candidatus Curtissbacteria bacterium GW2011_GWC1_44_33 TaxID=1618413 RepID=A0A0G1J3I5_9BACT|nr:MAG: Extracellular solute-binding protein family 5 [Candidatus Curtissbacteria bacterium GW2011_GWC1_44_33]
MGTGEWRVTKATVSAGFIQRLVLVDKEGDRKILKFYPTEERAKLGFKLGEIDILQDIFSPKPFNEWGVAEIEKEVGDNWYVAIFFNTQDKLLGEKSFRQALAYAVKKDGFDGPRAVSPISPNSWAFNPQVKPYHYDLVRAQELIDDLANELKENLTVNIVTTPALLLVAESIARDWAEVGVTGNVQVSSGVPAEYQALLAIFDIPEDPDQYSIWHSTQTSTNITRYQNPRIDKLLEDGRVELNLEERKKIYLDFQRFLVEDSPATFLYHPTTYTVKRK